MQIFYNYQLSIKKTVFCLKLSPLLNLARGFLISNKRFIGHIVTAMHLIIGNKVVFL